MTANGRRARAHAVVAASAFSTLCRARHLRAQSRRDLFGGRARVRRTTVRTCAEAFARTCGLRSRRASCADADGDRAAIVSAQPPPGAASSVHSTATPSTGAGFGESAERVYEPSKSRVALQVLARRCWSPRPPVADSREERTVALVRFGHRDTRCLSEPRMAAEGGEPSADDRGRIDAGVRRAPARSSPSSSRLTVRAGDGDALASPHQIGEQLRARRITGMPRTLGFDHLGVRQLAPPTTAPPHLRRRRVLRVVAFVKLQRPAISQVRRHRRRAGDPIRSHACPSRSRISAMRAHAAAADANEVHAPSSRAGHRVRLPRASAPVSAMRCAASGRANRRAALGMRRAPVGDRPPARRIRDRQPVPAQIALVDHLAAAPAFASTSAFFRWWSSVDRRQRHEIAGFAAQAGRSPASVVAPARQTTRSAAFISRSIS